MFGKKNDSTQKVVMPDPATLISCVEEVIPATVVENVNPIALDNMIISIKSILVPALQASDKDGMFIENEKYMIILMRTGMIKIIEKRGI